MRTNLPVSNIEFELRDGASIVSRTDNRGLINYLNPDFIEASGFTERDAEHHSRIRLPDVQLDLDMF